MKIKTFFSIIHLLLRHINFFMSRINLSTSVPQNVYDRKESIDPLPGERELYDFEAVRSVSSRAFSRRRFRTSEGRYRRGKNPRSITLLRERRKSIDLGTEAAARRLRRNRRWIRSLRHRARVSPRHASHLGESIFSKVRVRAEVVGGSVSYLTTLYKYNNIS